MSNSEQVDFGTQEQASIEPARMFAEHVKTVIAEGDALDAQHYLWQKPVLKAGAILGGATALAAKETLDYSADFNPTVNTAVLVIGGLFLARHFVKAPKDTKIGLQRFSAETQKAIGHEYELYRVKSPKGSGTKFQADMRWYGSTEEGPGDAIDDLVHIATLAKTNGVGQIAIGKDLAKSISADLPETNNTMTEFLSKKWLGVGGRAKKDQIYTKTPQEWLDLAKEERISQGYSVGAMIKRIESVRYDHPLARIAREFGTTGECSDLLARTARMGVERQIDDIQPARTKEGIRERHYVRGMIGQDGSFVHLLNDGKYNTTVPLDRAVGGNDEQLNRAIDNIDNDPQSAVRALEILIFKKLKQQEVHQQTRSEDNTASTPQSFVSSYQDELIRPKNNKVESGGKTSLLSRKILRGVNFATASLLIGVAVAAGYEQLDRAYSDEASIQRNIVAESTNAEPGEVDSWDPRVIDRMGPWQAWYYGANALYYATDALRFGVFDFSDSAYSELDNFVFLNNTNDSASSSSFSEMGNVDKESRNRADWHLSAHNMSTNGYWAHSVANSLHLDTNSYGVNMQWRQQNREGNTPELWAKQQLPTTLPEGVTSYISVNRELSYGDISDGVINLPVLEGTRPVAGMLNGKPITVVQRPNGTFFLKTDKDNQPGTNAEGNLVYWVMPSKKAPSPHREGRVAITDYTQNGIDYETHSNTAWGKLIPGLPPESGDVRVREERSKMIASYIQSNWRYQLSPWAKDAMKDVSSLEEQIKRAAEIAGANCNIANSLIAVENLDYAPVIGYLNGGNETNILSSHESHMWLANQSGDRLDGTPSGVTPEDQAFFEEKPIDTSKPGSSTSLWLYAELALLAGGVAAWRRKDIVKGIHNAEAVAANMSKRRLGSMLVDDLRLASTIMEQAVYAPTINLDKALARAKANKDSADEVVQRLLRTNAGLHSKQGEKQILTAAKAQTDPKAKQTLRQAAAVSKRSRRIANYSRHLLKS